jgi:L-glutamine-phosphate cytidylyltransferase
MRVIIPAAGRGTRLSPLTDFSPKCLVEVNGRPLIYYLLNGLARQGVEEVIIVTGYKSDMVTKYLRGLEGLIPIRVIYNELYDSTNSIVSLSLTMQYWKDDFCIIDSDLLLHDTLLQQLLQSKESCLIVDAEKEIDKMDMRVTIEQGNLVHMDKYLLRKDSHGEFFGLSRWTPSMAAVFSRIIEHELAAGNTNIWYEFAIRQIPQSTPLPVQTCSMHHWVEIDSMSDYDIAIETALKWYN